MRFKKNDNVKKSEIEEEISTNKNTAAYVLVKFTGPRANQAARRFERQFSWFPNLKDFLEELECHEMLTITELNTNKFEENKIITFETGDLIDKDFMQKIYEKQKESVDE